MSAAQDPQPFHWRYPNLDDKNFELHGRSLLILLLIIALLLLLTVIILYARWALHRPSPTTPTPTNPSTPLGLDPRIINSLPVVLYKQQGDEESADQDYSVCCSICLSVFVEGEKVKMLPRCRHSFHAECVDQWLKTRSSCPMCRAEIEGDGGGGV